MCFYKNEESKFTLKSQEKKEYTLLIPQNLQNIVCLKITKEIPRKS